MFMLTSEQTGLPIEALVALRREKLLAEGRHDAFIFVFECQCNVQCLHAEIQETEEKITNPPRPFEEADETQRQSARVLKMAILQV